MRFFRAIFWIAAFYHAALSLWLAFTPDLVILALDYPEQSPPFLVQFHGLFYFMMAFGLAYCAERPSKSIAIIGMAALASTLFPLFTGVAWVRGQLAPSAALFHGLNSLLWLPVFVSYVFWFYHVPKPTDLVATMGLFGRKRLD